MHLKKGEKLGLELYSLNELERYSMVVEEVMMTVFHCFKFWFAPYILFSYQKRKKTLCYVLEVEKGYTHLKERKKNKELAFSHLNGT